LFVKSICLLTDKLTQRDGNRPECGAIQENVTADIELIAQLTPRLRMYGADCNATALVLQAIQGIYLFGPMLHFTLNLSP